RSFFTPLQHTGRRKGKRRNGTRKSETSGQDAPGARASTPPLYMIREDFPVNAARKVALSLPLVPFHIIPPFRRAGRSSPHPYNTAQSPLASSPAHLPTGWLRHAHRALSPHGPARP